MKENVKINKMGTQPVSKVMLTMGIPMILSMVLQACYNIVDSMFVARIPDTNEISNMGEYAVNALTLAFPVQMLIVAFGIGTGVGVNALLAKSLGQNNKEKVAFVAGNGVALGLVIYVIFFILGFVGIDFYLQTQTENQIVISMGREYLMICTLLSVGIIMFSIYEKLLQSTGKTVYSTIAQIAGALTNIVLDPILIFGYFGIPQMGIAGAAYATVIGQFVSMIIAMIFHYCNNSEVKFGFRYFRLKFSVVKEIYIIGLPAIIMQALMSFMCYGVNIILGTISMSCVTAYGIFYKIQQFVFFAGFGLRDAITPIVSFNYGMNSKKRVKDGMKYGLLYISIISLLGSIALELFAPQLISLFGLSGGTADLCVTATHIISIGFLFAGGNIALQGVFQALGCGISSLVISLLRQFIIVLPLAILFSVFNNAEFWVWFAFPIAEIVALICAVVLMLKVYNSKINTMGDIAVCENIS